MSLRLLEIILPVESTSSIDDLPRSDTVLGRWDDRLNDEQAIVRLLVKASNTEAMLDDLEGRFAHVSGFRVILIPVEATLPRPASDDDATASQAAKSPERISREEIYADVSEGARISRTFVAQVIIATVVAAVGLMRNDNAVIIAAMVIAPLLGPNMSLCLATTLGDTRLALESLKANATGLSIALVFSMVLGAVFVIDVDLPSIQSRTTVSWGDILLALASGCAGVLAFTSGAPSALIGVMVAVALLPPFAVCGLLIGSGDFVAARGALLLVATNVICVNLSGVLTFAAQGLRPRQWWEAERAKKALQLAVGIWLLLLAVLIVLIYQAAAE
ncbi:putative hydrophobic protein (TIGR00341 family) [Rhodopirellula rubra]|uniref:Putative hydrophobic protein (TIGR00341 family) n=1 Tax=Aporhodopirellula rubra TaxID=980271 RepID=A0A7W5E3D9_9BACT|nr:TIGR00341 family protein [Aporhodopirellula rubra]MBB3209465.1 putative hydrophobic protein (TIGR00341 family) [Aporhodopirellula rubra]